MVSATEPSRERRAERDVAEVPARGAEHPVEPAGVPTARASSSTPSTSRASRPLGATVIHEPSSGSATGGARARSPRARAGWRRARRPARRRLRRRRVVSCPVLLYEVRIFRLSKGMRMVDTSSTRRRARRRAAALPAQRAGLRRRRGRALGLGPADLRCLDWLADGPKTAGVLATATGLRPAATTALIDRLEAKGLVERVRDETRPAARARADDRGGHALDLRDVRPARRRGTGAVQRGTPWPS